MPDDTADRSRQDQLRINVDEPHEVRYWTQRLGCTEQELRNAVASAGVMADDVRLALGEGMMVKRVILMLALWGGWALWQRANGRSPENPSSDGDVPLPVPYPET